MIFNLNIKKFKKILIVFLNLLLLLSCRENKQKESSNKELSKNNGRLILTENSFAGLDLAGVKLSESTLKKHFNKFVVTKNIGEQDGPNFFYYKIGEQASLNTIDTENSTLYQLEITEGSKAMDEYGVKLGMNYYDVTEKRPNMKISTEYFQVYLYKEGSNIAYKMSLGNYSGVDKEEYTLEDIKSYNSEVTSIIWYGNNTLFKLPEY